MSNKLTLGLIALFGVLMSFAAIAPSMAEEMPDAKELIAKSKERIMGLDSYSYTITGAGYETNLEEMNKRVSATAESVNKVGADKAAAEAMSKGKDREFRKYKTPFKFMKPYLCQMKVEYSDWVPKVIHGSLMTYRPDKNKDIFWIKLKLSPVAVKRGVDTESGTLFYSSMHMQYIHMEQLMQDVDPVVEGSKEIGGRDAWALAFNFKEGQKATEHPVDLEKWGIPKDVWPPAKKEALNYSKENYGKVVWYIDKQSLFPVELEQFARDGERMFLKDWKDIKENNLTEKDF